MNPPDQLRRAGKGDVRGSGGPDEALTQPKPTPPIWPLASEDFAIFTVCRLFSDTRKFFKIQFFMKPFPCH